jgi:ubiquitin C-terminal hydrolase
VEHLLIKRFVKIVHIGKNEFLNKYFIINCSFDFSRYSREEDFTLLSVDIRHSQNLKESLEQYVIGELLDGPNAYFCEKCNKKVNKSFYILFINFLFH